LNFTTSVTKQPVFDAHSPWSQDGRTPLHWAAMTENLAVLQTILSHHPEIDAHDDGGWTPLMIAGTYRALDNFTTEIPWLRVE
jgi:ankyrin repeat protein